MWYTDYFRPGNFTAGFDTWIENKKFNDSFSDFSTNLSFDENDNPVASVVACMNPNYQYQVKWNGKTIPYKLLTRGTLSIDIPINKIKDGKLEIYKNWKRIKILFNWSGLAILG